MSDQSIEALKGVGASTADRLGRMGIHTISELLEHFPLRYEDRTQRKNIVELQHGEFATFTATIMRGELHHVKGKSIARVSVRDDTGQALLVWFNQPYRATAWKPATEVTVYGRVNRFRDTLQIEAPEVETATQAESLNSARIVPIYPLTQGLGARALRKLMAAALSAQQVLPDTIPCSILQTHHLMDRTSALHEIHFPTDWESMQRAKRRIVFEELFYLQCALAYIRSQRVDDRRSIAHQPDGEKTCQLKKLFPFQLTDDQRTAYEEIRMDMESDRPMHRLLQGDVGSGKTAVALLALVKTIANGLQGVLMAPTEILAEQHFQTCSELFAGLGIRTAILTGTGERKCSKANPARLASW